MGFECVVSRYRRIRDFHPNGTGFSHTKIAGDGHTSWQVSLKNNVSKHLRCM